MRLIRPQCPIVNSLKGRLIVSCQAESPSLFEHPSCIAAFAHAAAIGGAAAVRIRTVEHICAVRRITTLPIIGLTKGQYPDGSVLITPTSRDALELQSSGADIIAVDGTLRPRPYCCSGTEFIRELKKLGVPLVLADIATVEDGLAAASAGADLLATTLSGYTAETQKHVKGPDFQLIRQLSDTVPLPVIAEGRIWTPEEAVTALEFGAWAIVVGSAITRPHEIVRRFAEALPNNTLNH